MPAATKASKGAAVRSRKIRVDDTVAVRTGKDAGKRGTVIKVLPADERVIVEQLNMVKRHTRARPPANPQQAARQQPTGGVLEKEAPIHISNVQIVDDQGKPTRIGYKVDENGTKVRIARTTGKEL